MNKGGGYKMVRGWQAALANQNIENNLMTLK